METAAIALPIVDTPPRNTAPAETIADAELPIDVMTHGMRKGDERAWQAFHRRYHASLLRAAAAQARDIDFETAVQMTYLRVARHIKAFDNEADFNRWLRCILRCAIIDLQRERQRTHRLLESFHHWMEMRRSQHTAPAQKNTEAALDEALQKLDQADATLLRRKYHEGWTTAELAASADCSEKAIETRLARLRSALKKQILGGNSHA